MTQAATDLRSARNMVGELSSSGSNRDAASLLSADNVDCHNSYVLDGLVRLATRLLVDDEEQLRGIRALCRTKASRAGKYAPIRAALSSRRASGTPSGDKAHNPLTAGLRSQDSPYMQCVHRLCSYTGRAAKSIWGSLN